MLHYILYIYVQEVNMNKTDKVEKLESKITKLESKIYEARVKLEAEKHGLHKKTVKTLGLI